MTQHLAACARSLLVAAGLACVSAPAQAGPTLVIEAESGRVLHAIGAFDPWYPASVTKVMTAYLVFRAVETGRITMDTPILISEYAASQVPSKMGFPPGTAVTIDDALRMLMVKSANDIAVALAEGVSGSVQAFAQEMNQAAAQLGMRHSHFVNPNGLHDDRQFTTAHDLAILARTLLKKYPQHAAFYDLPAIRVGKRLMRNSNNMIGKYDGINGLKTGFTCPSGLNIVATASRHGRQLIAVVLGAKTGVQRAEIAASILEEGFASPVSSFAAERIDTMARPADAAAVPVDLRAAVCGPRKKATPEDMQLVAVNSLIDLERGRRALGPIEESEEGDGSPLVERGPPSIATFATGEKAKPLGAAAEEGDKPEPKPARDTAKVKPKGKVAAKPKETAKPAGKAKASAGNSDSKAKPASDSKAKSAKGGKSALLPQPSGRPFGALA